MTTAAPASKWFLPYQVRWLLDESRMKIKEKSRRIGMTYVQSYEDVRDAARQDGPMDVWFSSADQSAAYEYIQYCSRWARLLRLAGEYLGETIIDSDQEIKAYTIAFATGKRINALSSNPKAFRSKGGKLVLDEFAFHRQPEELWRAAAPVITWGYPVRVLSTYNGKGNRYYRMVEDARKGNGWSLHTTTIVDAVAQGLADRIRGRALTPAEREAFVQECRDIAGDEETFQQEYLCNPIDEATAWLTWELITGCEHDRAGDPAAYTGGPCYAGMDIGRRRDLTVIWVVEQVADTLWTREVVRMKGASFAAQDRELARIMRRYNVLRLCMDQTGMGEKMVEDAQRLYGSTRVEGVLFSAAVKQTLATAGKQKFEDRLLRIPADRAIRESHHAVRKVTTVAGNPRFDADRSEVGHADEFWAHMLAIHAADHAAGPVLVASRGTRAAASMLARY